MRKENRQPKIFMTAQWIDNPDFDGRSVSSFFCNFSAKKGLISACLSVAAAGFFQSYVNEQVTDEEYYKPVLTDFAVREQLRLAEQFSGGRKKLTYYTYDVTSLVTEGENNLEILLGTGFYYNVEKADLDPSFSFGTPKLMFALELTYSDGKESVLSGEDCSVRLTNRSSLMFGGDRIDYSATYGAAVKARITLPYEGELIEPETTADRVRSEFICEKPTNVQGGVRYDFGCNHTGGLKLKIRGARGTKVTVRYAEVLDEKGGLNLLTGGWIGYDKGEPVRTLLQQDEFILSGDVDEFSPLFCFHCYRYAEITADTAVEILDIKSLFICTPLVKDGEYSFGGGFLDSLSKMFEHTQLCASHCGVPMDCPHREKLPYTGDGWLTLESAFYLFDAEQFYAKWLDDVLEAQGKSGFVPYSAPYMGGGGGYAWGNAIVETPMLLYRLTGDKSYITRALSGAFKWLEYYDKKSTADGSVHGTDETWLLGDWLSPEYNTFDVVFMSTLCRFRATDLTMEMCQVAGEKAKAVELAKRKEVLRRQINARFYNPISHNYLSGRQGENILPVAYGIAQPEELPFILQNLRKLYKDKLNCHLDTGVVATPLLFDVLLKNGLKDLAYDILISTGYPSFSDMMKGETTLCEHWSKKFPDYISGGSFTNGGAEASHCHPMFGSVTAWMYKHIAGMDLSELYNKNIIFAPKFTDKVLSASAYKKLESGTVGIRYNNNGLLNVEISVPQGYTGVCIFEGVEGNVKVNGRTKAGIFARKDGRTELKLSAGIWTVQMKTRNTIVYDEEDLRESYGTI